MKRVAGRASSWLWGRLPKAPVSGKPVRRSFRKSNLWGSPCISCEETEEQEVLVSNQSGISQSNWPHSIYCGRDLSYSASQQSRDSALQPLTSTTNPNLDPASSMGDIRRARFPLHLAAGTSCATPRHRTRQVEGKGGPGSPYLYFLLVPQDHICHTDVHGAPLPRLLREKGEPSALHIMSLRARHVLPYTLTSSLSPLQDVSPPPATSSPFTSRIHPFAVGSKSLPNVTHSQGRPERIGDLQGDRKTTWGWVILSLLSLPFSRMKGKLTWVPFWDMLGGTAPSREGRSGLVL